MGHVRGSNLYSQQISVTVKTCPRITKDRFYVIDRPEMNPSNPNDFFRRHRRAQHMVIRAVQP